MPPVTIDTSASPHAIDGSAEAEPNVRRPSPAQPRACWPPAQFNPQLAGVLMTPGRDALLLRASRSGRPALGRCTPVRPGVPAGRSIVWPHAVRSLARACMGCCCSHPAATAAAAAPSPRGHHSPSTAPAYTEALSRGAQLTRVFGPLALQPRPHVHPGLGPPPQHPTSSKRSIDRPTQHNRTEIVCQRAETVKRLRCSPHKLDTRLGHRAAC